MIRVLGKGLTAQSIKKKFNDVILYDEENFNTYDTNSDALTIVSPGIAPHNKMVKKAKNLQSDYDLLAHKMPFSIWISGTNGKTTTTKMIQHLLKKYGSVLGGNIGIPICKLDEKSKIWVLETSSFTLHYTKKAKPNLYILLPISEDHISWHGSFQGYKQAKLKPLKYMKEGDISIIPKEFEAFKTKAYLITYKNSEDLCEKFDINKSKINFKEPFLLDALLALATKKIIFDNLDYENINSFKIDEHKIEEVFDKQNRLWINDSKATNVGATIKALTSYKEYKLHLILGGDDKGIDLKPLFTFLNSFDVTIYAVGSNFRKIVQLSREYCIKCYASKTLKNAVLKISTKHDINSVCILSPAASSLDQFSSYAHRGDFFKELIGNLSLN